MDPKHWLKLLTETWLKITLIDMHFYNAIFEVDYNILPAPKGNNVYIMDQYFQQNTTVDMKKVLFNWYRMYSKHFKFQSFVDQIESLLMSQWEIVALE